MLLVRMQGQRTYRFSSCVLFPYTYLFVRLSVSTEREPSPSYTTVFQQKKAHADSSWTSRWLASTRRPETYQALDLWGIPQRVYEVEGTAWGWGRLA
jgi:hypothetical protein